MKAKNKYGPVNSEIKPLNLSHAFKSKKGKFINSINCKNSSEKVAAMGKSQPRPRLSSFIYSFNIQRFFT